MLLTVTPTAPRPTATATPRPTATPAASGPKSTPTAPTAPTKPAGSAMDQFAKANPRLAAAQAEKDRIRGTSQSDNPLMKDMKDRMPMTPSVQSPTLAKDLGGGSGNQSLLDNPNASKATTPKKTPITSGFDMFDVVKGYLIGEGYADTEEAALAIMANMSEDWKYSILSEAKKTTADDMAKGDLYSAMFRRDKKVKGAKYDNPSANKYLNMKNSKDRQKEYDDDMGNVHTDRRPSR